MVKMTKCRPNVHTLSHAEWSSDTPTNPHCGSAPHLTQRAAEYDPIYGILNGSISIRKLGIFRVPGVYKDEVVKRVPYSVKRVPYSVKRSLNSVKRTLNSVKRTLNSVKRTRNSHKTSQTAVLNQSHGLNQSYGTLRLV